MGGSSFGTIFKITTWGESHGPALGVTIDGCPAGIELTEEYIQKDLDRRRVGQSKVTSKRDEPDKANILSGVFNDITTGTPISIVINNKDADSSKYSAIKDVFRPGHADYTYFKKYNIRDYRGGGRASARETAARVAAGAIAKKVLSVYGIIIYGYTIQIGDIKAEGRDFLEIEKNIVRCADKERAEEMVEKIMEVKKDGDSIGGIIEITVKGVPTGLGEPVFDRLDADLAKAMMSIPAIKGVEIGDGFSSSSKLGSENNDEFYIQNGDIKQKKNSCGGILGGISTGDDIILRIAVKPTPSILKTQSTVDENMKEVELTVEGRHDPCICPRAVPVAEAMTALVLVDHLFRDNNTLI